MAKKFGFGERLKSIRTAAGIGRNDLACRMGVTTQTIGRWETGSANPELSRIPALADALSVDPGDLFRPIGRPTTSLSLAPKADAPSRQWSHSFGRRLSATRRACDRSISDVCEECAYDGMTAEQLSAEWPAYESGDLRPNVVALDNFCERYGAPLCWLAFGRVRSELSEQILLRLIAQNPEVLRNDKSISRLIDAVETRPMKPEGSTRFQINHRP